MYRARDTKLGREVALARTDDVTADGQRFVLLESTAEAPGAQTPDLFLMQHWAPSLGRRDSAPR